MSEEHENFIKTPKQLVIVVVLAFVVPIIGIVLLSQLMTGDRKTGEEAPSAVLDRIKPVGELVVAGPKVLLAGDKVYETVCKACHDAGLLEAPKLGDKAGWAKRIAQGQATVVKNAINGLNNKMPPRGGNPDLTDEEVAGAVVFMANQAGATWKAPELKAPEKK